MGRRKGKSVRKNKQVGAKVEEPEELSRAPHSFVVHRCALLDISFLVKNTAKQSRFIFFFSFLSRRKEPTGQAGGSPILTL